MKKKRSDDARHIEGWQSKNERIESLLNVLYDFRFNTVKSRTEYRAASSSGLYQPVTKFVLNSFRRRLDATAGIVTSADNIRTILESDFARKATSHTGILQRPAAYSIQPNTGISAGS